MEYRLWLVNKYEIYHPRYEVELKPIKLKFTRSKVRGENIGKFRCTISIFVLYSWWVLESKWSKYIHLEGKLHVHVSKPRYQFSARGNGIRVEYSNNQKILRHNRHWTFHLSIKIFSNQIQKFPLKEKYLFFESGFLSRFKSYRSPISFLCFGGEIYELCIFLTVGTTNLSVQTKPYIIHNAGEFYKATQISKPAIMMYLYHRDESSWEK